MPEDIHAAPGPAQALPGMQVDNLPTDLVPKEPCKRLFNPYNPHEIKCAEPSDVSKPRTPQVRFISREHALEIVTKVLKESGEKGYKILPQDDPHDPRVTFRYADGSSGSFLGMVGNTATADDHAASTAGNFTKACRGTPWVTKKKISSTDGTVKRRLDMACRDDRGSTISSIVVYINRYPDGTLISVAGLRQDRIKGPRKPSKIPSPPLLDATDL